MTKLIRFFSAFFAATLLASTMGFAADLQAGRDYTQIESPLSTARDKIEVVEFFSYGCPHCNDFHPLLDAWAAKLPKDVILRRIPVSFNRAPWARLSRIYFALEAMGELPRIDGAVFKALHEDRVNFNSDEAVVNWAVKNGLDGKKFDGMLTSFSIQSKVQQADQEAAKARIQGVPSLIVDGRFLLSNEAAGSYEELLKRADFLIAKVRKEKKGK